MSKLTSLDLREANTVSPDGRCIVCFHQPTFWDTISSKRFVLVSMNGEPFPLRMSPNQEDFLFSPDGRHWSCWVPTGSGDCAVIVDGKEITRHKKVHSLVFSGDGGHVGFVAMQEKKWHAIVDGRSGSAYDQIRPGTLTLNEDATFVTYEAQRNKVWVGVANGKEVDFSQAGRRLFHEDGTVLAEVVDGDDGESVTVRGKAGRVYDKIEGRLFLSADGRHIAYSAMRNDRWYVIHDSVKSSAYDAIDSISLVLSSNGARLAFSARKGSLWKIWQDQWHAVVDGCESPAYASVDAFVFSPDGSRLAYRVTAGLRGACVVDGTVGPFADAVERPIFSPDGKHILYVAKHSRCETLVRDGKAGPLYESVSNPIFSGDSMHVVYIAKRAEGQSCLVLDGKELPTSFDIARMVGFEGTGLLYALALRRTEGAELSLSYELEKKSKIPAEAIRIEHQLV